MSLLKLCKKVQQEILKGQKIPLEALEVIAKIKPDSKQIEAFERYTNNEIDIKTMKMEYLSSKSASKEASISFNEKKRIVSINLNKYKSKEGAVKAFADFLSDNNSHLSLTIN